MKFWVFQHRMTINSHSAHSSPGHRAALIVQVQNEIHFPQAQYPIRSVLVLCREAELTLTLLYHHTSLSKGYHHTSLSKGKAGEAHHPAQPRGTAQLRQRRRPGGAPHGSSPADGAPQPGTTRSAPRTPAVPCSSAPCWADTAP